MRTVLVIVVALAGGALALAGAVRADEPTDGGAVISVQVGDGGATTLDVQRGEVKVRSNGTETRVAAGESLHAQKGKPPRHVLRAPTNLAPPDGATLPTLAFKVRFDKVRGANGYRVEVATDRAFHDVVWRAPHVADTSVEPRVKQAGTYFWRVVAVNAASEVVGKPSAPRRVVIDTTPPKLKAGQPRWK
jgi:hypothetical protein